MENRMQAAVKTADGRFDLKEVNVPDIMRPDWVVARVRMSGICGTDLRYWKKAEEQLAGKIMEHELAVGIVEVGSNVTNVKVGDRVVIETLLDPYVPAI